MAKYPRVMSNEPTIPLSDIDDHRNEIKAEIARLNQELQILDRLRNACLANHDAALGGAEQPKQLKKTQAIRKALAACPFEWTRVELTDRVEPHVVSRPGANSRRSLYTTICNMLSSGELVADSDGKLGLSLESQIAMRLKPNAKPEEQNALAPCKFDEAAKSFWPAIIHSQPMQHDTIQTCWKGLENLRHQVVFLRDPDLNLPERSQHSGRFAFDE